MDRHLKVLAGASLDVEAAEEALTEGANHTARDRIDVAAAALADLREQWPAMSGAERSVVGPAARDVRERLDSAAARLPRLSALSEAPGELDPEEEVEP